MNERRIVRSDRRDEGDEQMDVPKPPALPPLRKFLVVRYLPPTADSPFYVREEVLKMGHSIDFSESGILFIHEIRLLNGQPAAYIAHAFANFDDVQEVDFPEQVAH